MIDREIWYESEKTRSSFSPAKFMRARLLLLLPVQAKARMYGLGAVPRAYSVMIQTWQRP